MNGKFYPFRPNIHGVFLERFQEKAMHLVEKNNIKIIIEDLATAEYNWATFESEINPRQRKIYRSVWLVLRDLIRVGWRARWNDGNLEITPPNDHSINNNDLKSVKSNIRSIMQDPRAQKLLDSRDFIDRMELDNMSRMAIDSLIANGKDLASDLKRLKLIDDEEVRASTARQVISPYIQLVQEGAVCEYTGHKLSDIWRYFRYTWATPYEPTPGRTMQYLIRDAARPNHPIMGITSLENVPIIINDRDNHIGWTYESFKERVNLSDNSNEKLMAFKQLLTYIENSIEDINVSGLCTREECEEPTDGVVQRLIRTAGNTENERDAALKAWEDKTDEDGEILEKSALGNISKFAEEALFKRKRAEQLAKLLNAKIGITNLLNHEEFESELDKFLESDYGKSLIKVAFIAQKNKHIGTSMMELNVCGAIPPYNEILGGKLAALVMLSKEVVDDYRKKYGNRPSDIASRLKGEPVIRKADLVYIGTTSLYKVGSSQYNRLKLPKGILKANGKEVKLKRIGETKGYGTMHISRLTLQTLEDNLLKKDRGSINRIFGEGASPKLRTIRAGLEKIFDTRQREFIDLIPKHAMARLIYGAWLVENGTEYLTGKDEKPNYYFDEKMNGKEATEKIVEYWRQRWLLSRLNHVEALNRIEKFDSKSLLLGYDVEAVKDNYSEIEVIEMKDTGESEDLKGFLRNLYRGSSAYADRVDIDFLNSIHVPTKLDDAIIESIKAGKSVVLTGNPGDGKTHLLRILETKLENIEPKPIVEYDASSITDDDLFMQWKLAESKNIPYCVAINEAVLINLANKHVDFESLQEARNQVINAINYKEENTTENKVVVFDLSRRNVLTEETVTAVIDKLLVSSENEKEISVVTKGSDFERNKKLLKNVQVRKRLQLILDRVSRKGYHATLRELQSLVSYLLFAGRTYEEMLETSGEDRFAFHQLIYAGEGKLFDLIRETFDPAQISHPIWDDNLIYGEVNSDGWIEEAKFEIGAIDPSNNSRFFSRKRAFYFYHESGQDIMDLAGDDESKFAEFLEMPQRNALRQIIQRINRFFGDESNSDSLRVWQSHRYNQSPRKVLYSAKTREKKEFLILAPILRRSMKEAFDLNKDHLTLFLKDNPQVRLKIDFHVFELLSKAERGVPVMSLEGDASRRIWKFMEKLSEPFDFINDPEIKVTIFDTTTRQKIEVITDVEFKKYISIEVNE